MENIIKTEEQEYLNSNYASLTYIDRCNCRKILKKYFTEVEEADRNSDWFLIDADLKKYQHGEETVVEVWIDGLYCGAFSHDDEVRNWFQNSSNKTKVYFENLHVDAYGKDEGYATETEEMRATHYAESLVFAAEQGAFQYDKITDHRFYFLCVLDNSEWTIAE